MLKTFNCGIGMVVVAAQGAADTVITALGNAGESPIVIGEITAPERCQERRQRQGRRVGRRICGDTALRLLTSRTEAGHGPSCSLV